ncbi:MAG TPA: hypothetical protein VK327_00840 [Candidatus Paceibacterota bacterium]|nr:hypothetical protein [Candidatus Paceibacterota bacterium]
MKNVLSVRVFGFLLVIGFLVGCGPEASLESSFKNAPSEVRDKLEEAMRLDHRNDYMAAAESYDAVIRQEITSEQRSLLTAAVNRMYSRMVKAAAGGDPEAKRTVEYIERMRKEQR